MYAIKIVVSSQRAILSISLSLEFYGFYFILFSEMTNGKVKIKLQNAEFTIGSRSRAGPRQFMT